MILRRLYLYLVSAAALALLASGLCLLGGTVLLFAFDDPSAQYNRTQLAAYTAMTLVALTGWGLEDDRRRSREAGFDHHLVKPVDPQALERLLGEAERG